MLLDRDNEVTWDTSYFSARLGVEILAVQYV